MKHNDLGVKYNSRFLTYMNFSINDLYHSFVILKKIN